MTKTWHFDPNKVTYRLDIQRDETPVRGNAMASGDDGYDREVENAILRRSSPWAWGVVTVTATYEGIDCIAGRAVLGCCSYKDETDFRQCCFDDMKDEAMRDLREQLEQIYQLLSNYR